MDRNLTFLECETNMASPRWSKLALGGAVKLEEPSSLCQPIMIRCCIFFIDLDDGRRCLHERHRCEELLPAMIYSKVHYSFGALTGMMLDRPLNEVLYIASLLTYHLLPRWIRMTTKFVVLLCNPAFPRFWRHQDYFLFGVSPI